jgi:hypothetical protein
MGRWQNKLGPLHTIREWQLVSCQCVAFKALAVARLPLAQGLSHRLVSLLSEILGQIPCQMMGTGDKEWLFQHRSHAGKFCKSWVATRIKDPVLIFAVGCSAVKW